MHKNPISLRDVKARNSRRGKCFPRRWPQARLTRGIGENRRKLLYKSIYRRVPVRMAEFTVGDVEGYDVQNSGSACLDLAETC